MEKIKTDFVVIGAGIVGMATALEWQRRHPKQRVIILDKEPAASRHQTGRNSGVIHAGVYYASGSLKATLCKQGWQDTLDFCQKNTIEYDQCGKLIVATNSLEQERLDPLFERCQQNDLKPIRLSQQQLNKYEPNIVGKEAILVKQTAITNYTKITQAMLAQFQALGGQVRFKTQVSHIESQDSGAVVIAGDAQIAARFAVNCAGLMNDRIARKSGVDLDFRIIPFKGEYYRLSQRYQNITKHLIYPVPDPALPFLGVHLTKMINGDSTVGPNAVLSLAREGYDPYSFNFKDAMESCFNLGFWKLVAKYPRSTLAEIYSALSKRHYLRLVQKYCSQIQLSDLHHYPSGIRAQAVDNKGNLIHDFKFVDSPNCLHVGNAPSPAATSAMPIARLIVDKVQKYL